MTYRNGPAVVTNKKSLVRRHGPSVHLSIRRQCHNRLHSMMSNEATARPTFDPPCSNFIFFRRELHQGSVSGHRMTIFLFSPLRFPPGPKTKEKSHSSFRRASSTPPLNSSLPLPSFFWGGDRPPSRPKSPSFPSSSCRRRLHFGSVESTAFSRPYRSRRRERENRRLPASQTGRKLFEGRGRDRVVEMTALRFRDLREIRPWRGGRPIGQKQKRRRRARESQ